MTATYRQVQSAVNLIINGAMRDIDTGSGTVDKSDNLETVLDAVIGVVDDWDGKHCNLIAASNMVMAMQIMLEDTACPQVIRELLAHFDLEP